MLFPYQSSNEAPTTEGDIDFLILPEPLVDRLLPNQMSCQDAMLQIRTIITKIQDLFQCIAHNAHLIATVENSG